MEPSANPDDNARTSLELLYNISREFAAALDLRAVLQRVLKLSMENVGAVSGSIIVLDDTGQAIESAFLMHGKAYDQSVLNLRVTLENGLAGWVARQRQAVLVPDTSRDERWLRRPDDQFDRTGPKSAVGVPILNRDQLVGVMTLVHSSPGFFNVDNLALVRSIADQAGIAILNARLYAESQRRARVMTAVAESAAAITESLDLDVVLRRILDQILHALRVEAVLLALVDPHGTELEYRAATGFPIRSVIGLRTKVGKGIPGWVARYGLGAMTPDAYQDPRFDPDLDQWLHFHTRAAACAPIRSQGKVIGVLEALNPVEGGFATDDLAVLTEIGGLAGSAIRHAQLYESLQAAHQRYHDLFQDSINPILVTDWDGKLIEANRIAEQTTGLRGSTLQASNIAELHMVDESAVGLGFAHLHAGETVSYESSLHTVDSGDIPVQVFVRRILIDKVSYLQWIFDDITEQKNLDVQRHDLIAMIYHDLRAPLANIVSSLDVLASFFPEDDGQSIKPIMKIIERSVGRIQRLTDSLLDINRLEAGQPIGNRQVIAPQDLINDAVDGVYWSAQSRGVQVEKVDIGQLPDVWVDADMLRRVLINLLENGIKFTPGGLTLEVGARPSGAMVQFWVRDAGPGIAPEDAARIFDKHFRIIKENSARGFGLGLAFCRLAVEAHGGKIWVDSKLGEGATFSFTVPVQKEND
jgi:PAS domain S-box-containing protein